MSQKLSAILFASILLLAAFFRLHNVNWDENQHLHPDERFLTMVTGSISWPTNLSQYLDTNRSPLNPHNQNYSFFVYGTFPIFFTNYVSEVVKQPDYNGITIVGRKLSAIFDLGTVILVFLIAKQLLKRPRPKADQPLAETINLLPHLSMLLYACLVLPIQLSHFYAVDSYLTFFTTLSFYLLINLLTVNFNIFNTLLLGISLGLGVASKISAVYFLPIIALGFVLHLIKNKNFYFFILSSILIFVSGYFTIRLAQPYLFSDTKLISIKLNPKILENWKELKSFDNPNSYFPPGVQWIKTKAYIFPLKNIIFWGMGLPIGLISLSAIFFLLWQFCNQIYRKKFSSLISSQNLILNLSLLWILMLFIYQGIQFVKALRYFFSLYPFLAILSAWFSYFVFSQIKQNQKLYRSSILIYILLILIYPVSFSSIYSRTNTRIKASQWIFQNIPPHSRISGEHWDDFLPMSLPTEGMIREKYQGIEYPLYNEDTKDKWAAMNQKLINTDYIIMSSNRLYGSIMTVPDKYPVTYKYYQSLFDGSLGFAKVAEFTSRPNLSLPFIKLCLTPPFARYGFVAIKTQGCSLSGISFVDDYADETFTVYDHPKVLIFKKVKQIDYLNLLSPPKF